MQGFGGPAGRSQAHDHAEHLDLPGADAGFGGCLHLYSISFA
jgi:hypothetical protein